MTPYLSSHFLVMVILKGCHCQGWRWDRCLSWCWKDVEEETWRSDPPLLQSFVWLVTKLLYPWIFQTFVKWLTHTRKLKGMFQYYRFTKESLSTLSYKDVDEAINHPPVKKKVISNQDIQGIKKLLPLTDEEITTS